jgi:hypothetical protein
LRQVVWPPELFSGAPAKPGGRPEAPGAGKRAGVTALSKDGDELLARTRTVYSWRRKLRVELVRRMGSNMPVIGQAGKHSVRYSYA